MQTTTFRRGYRLNRIARAAALLLLLGMLIASSARAAVWSPAVNLSATEGNALQSQVGMGPDGTATAVWTYIEGSTNRIQMRRIAPDGTPATATTQLAAADIATGEGVSRPRLAILPDGGATVVWLHQNPGGAAEIQSRRIAPDGTPAPTIHDLSAAGGNAEQHQVAVGPGGTATVVWRWNDTSTGDQFIQARRIAPDGTPAPTTNDLAGSSGQSPDQPQVAVGPDGTATVVWLLNDTSTGDRFIQERRIAPNGTPDPTTNDLAGGSGQFPDQPQVAAGPDASATGVWELDDGSGNRVIQSRRIAPNGTPDAATNDLSASSGENTVPQIAVGPDGTATVVWQGSDGATYIRIEERRIAPDGTPDPVVNDLSASAAFTPDVAVGADGTASVVWSRADLTGDLFSNQLVQALRISHGGTLSAVADLSAPAAVIEEEEFGTPQVAAGPGSTATAVWGRYPARYMVQASTFAEPPSSPSNSFSIGKNKRNKKRGTVTLPVNVPGPGTLRLRGKGMYIRGPLANAVAKRGLGPWAPRYSAKLQAAGTVKLVVKARAGTKVILNNRGKVKVTPTVTYTPTGGAANSKSRTLMLRKRLPAPK